MSFAERRRTFQSGPKKDVRRGNVATLRPDDRIGLGPRANPRDSWPAWTDEPVGLAEGDELPDPATISRRAALAAILGGGSSRPVESAHRRLAATRREALAAVVGSSAVALASFLSSRPPGNVATAPPDPGEVTEAECLEIRRRERAEDREGGDIREIAAQRKAARLAYREYDRAVAEAERRLHAELDRIGV